MQRKLDKYRENLVRLRQPESSTDIFLYLGHARAHDKENPVRRDSRDCRIELANKI